MKVQPRLGLCLFLLPLLSGCAAPQGSRSAPVNEATALKEESLQDYKARMAWFAEAQYGLFIHFGLYSQLGGQWKGEEVDWYSEWIQASKDIPREEYAKIIHDFNPVGFDADKIVRAAKEAGMTYLVITSKHHEGFCLWDSAYTEFDVASSPFAGRDILAELKAACERYGLRFGIYYSIIDWNHPSQEPTMQGKHPFSRWGHTFIKPGQKETYLAYQTNQILELIESYDPALLWFDGDWTNWWTLQDGIQLYNTIRQASPSIIVNNRVAKRDRFHLDFVTQEQEHFDDAFPSYWEGCYTMNKSWGYKKHDHEWKDAETVYNKLKDINEKGGSLLLNVGPDGRGIVQEEAYAILRETAQLLKDQPIQKKLPQIEKTPGVVGGTARKTWRDIVDRRLRDRPEYEYVENEPGLPNVLIYGDSISMGYGPEVRRQLQGIANVYRLHVNGGDSSTFIPKMKDLHNAMRDPLLDEPWDFDWDIIQFNNGIHDLTYRDADGERDKVNGKPQVPIEAYKKNLEANIAYLRTLAPQAQLIFVLTTPIPENEPGRYAGDAVRYNEAALEVLRGHPDILINDLWSVTKPHHEQWWSKPGNVHYNEIGKTKQGEHVATFLREVLQ